MAAREGRVADRAGLDRWALGQPALPLGRLLFLEAAAALAAADHAHLRAAAARGHASERGPARAPRDHRLRRARAARSPCRHGRSLRRLLRSATQRPARGVIGPRRSPPRLARPACGPAAGDPVHGGRRPVSDRLARSGPRPRKGHDLAGPDRAGDRPRRRSLGRNRPRRAARCRGDADWFCGPVAAGPRGNRAVPRGDRHRACRGLCPRGRRRPGGHEHAPGPDRVGSRDDPSA